MNQIKQEIQERISKFRKDVINKEFTDCYMVRKYVLDAIPFYYRKNPDSLFDLKNEIANKFEIGTSEIEIVGSAKLGFSINPNNPPFKQFNEESDIDIAIVSNELFERYWINLLDAMDLFSQWKASNNSNKFYEYFFHGWMRPDKLPSNSESCKEWWEFFEKLSTRLDLADNRIRAGLYRTWKHLETYQSKSIRTLRKIVEGGLSSG